MGDNVPDDDIRAVERMIRRSERSADGKKLPPKTLVIGLASWTRAAARHPKGLAGVQLIAQKTTGVVNPTVMPCIMLFAYIIV